MAWQLVSPYSPSGGRCRWLRGNHHGHSTRSDGQDEPLDLLHAYEAAGYDYIALSEHDLFVDPAVYRHQTRMTVLPAVEVTSVADQTLMALGLTDGFPAARTLSLKAIAEWVSARGGLFIADHPNWLYQPLRHHVSLAEMLAAPAAGAIEIYTGVIERLPGSAYALDLWDTLLSLGRRVFGHAVDDQHRAVDRFLGWNCVQLEAEGAITAAAIIAALRAGRFYASTGVTIQDVGLVGEGEEQSIRVRSDATSIRWIVRDGRLAHVTQGGEAQVTIPELLDAPRLGRPCFASDLVYVRAELVGDNGAYAWTQPFSVESAR